MFIIKAPISAVKRLATSRRWRTAIFLTAGLAIVATRARTVISAAPRRSKAAVQELSTDMRTMFGKEQGAHQPASDDKASQRVAEMATGSVSPSAGAAQDNSAATTSSAESTKTEGAAAAYVPGDQPVTASTAPTPPETIEAGEDETGTFRPTRAETDDFGVIVTDDEPAGLAAIEHWVKGDGSATCPEGYPVKGNANSRIYHRPGEPSYEQTIPEVCFANEEEAQLAGYRPRKT